MLVMVPIIYLAMLHGVSGAHLRKRRSLTVSAVTFNAGNTWAAPALQDKANDAKNLVTTFVLTGSTGNGTESRANMDKFQEDRRIMMGLGGDGLMTDDIVVVGLQEFGGGRGYGGELFNFHDAGYTDHHERYFSGPLCHLPGVAHYDTILHVYVKEGITHVPYNSSTCKIFDEMVMPGLKDVKASAGCSINNNVVNAEKFECGKVVNLLKFKVAEGVHFCAMNTHMSFAFAAEHRMNLIAKAMEEAVLAECTVTVFLGDFNSRLHCHDPGEDNDTNLDLAFAPVTSVKEFFNIPWDGEKGHQQQDELSQLLKEETVECYDKSKKRNQLNRLPKNTVKTHGFQEPEVTFPPTYKLVTKKKAEGIAEKVVNGEKQTNRVSCEGYNKDGKGPAMEMKEMCYGNKDGKEKHNPAWTDRIIYKVKDKIEVVGEPKYESRVVNNYFVTDHAAVGAAFEFAL